MHISTMWGYTLQRSGRYAIDVDQKSGWKKVLCFVTEFIDRLWKVAKKW